MNDTGNVSGKKSNRLYQSNAPFSNDFRTVSCMTETVIFEQLLPFFKSYILKCLDLSCLKKKKEKIMAENIMYKMCL